MSKFIELSDYDASIHREILDALTREDDAVVEICEDRAVAEMRCYLSRRYDCDKIFTATGDKRNQLVLMMAIDIAVYHIFCIHNPRNLSPLRKERHERAVEWLKAVAAIVMVFYPPCRVYTWILWIGLSSFPAHSPNPERP